MQGQSLTNYRCFHNPDDLYNYAPLNLLVTPQERGSLFSKFNYKINDDVEAYASVLYNRTRSGFQFAALPFDAQTDNVVISKNSIYNPFGIDFGGNTTGNTNAQWRLLGLNPRNSDSISDSKVASLGLKGKLLNTGWEWDLFSMYGRLDQTALINGYFFGNACCKMPWDPRSSALAECRPAAQPQRRSLTARPLTSSRSTIRPVRPPHSRAAFTAVSTGYNTDHTFTTRNVALDLNGKVWTLPAGDIQASVGAEYRYQEGIFKADQIVQAQPPLFADCAISNEACTGNSRAHYSNKEFYGELFVPILKNVPGAYALNIDAGVRYSDYTIFKKTTRAQFKLEYRPIADLMIRSTFAQVYRAPTIQDIAQAPAIEQHAVHRSVHRPDGGEGCCHAGSREGLRRRTD